MPYVDRDSQGRIVGIFNVAQHDGQEYIEGDVSIQPAPLTLDDQKAAIWADFKARREVYLNRLTGIAGRAERNGLAAIADAADDFSQGLLDLPSHPSVQPDVTPTAESLTAAILTQYRALATIAKATPGATTEFDKVSA